LISYDVLGINSNNCNDIMDKRQKLSSVVDKLKQLTEFLKPYLPLANVHNTNFIVSNHWDTMIPHEVGLELLQLDDNQLSLLPAGELYNYQWDHIATDSFHCDVKDGHAFMNPVEDHSSFSSKSHFMTTCDPCPEYNSANITHVEEVATASCNLGNTNDEKWNSSHTKTDVRNILTVCHPTSADIEDNRLPEWDHSLIPDWRHKTLSEFIMAAVLCSLPQLGLLTSLADLSDVLGLQPFDEQSRIVVSHAMKIKKSYEVDIMSSLCAWIAKGFNVSSVSNIAMYA